VISVTAITIEPNQASSRYIKEQKTARRIIMAQTIFERYEKKYILASSQYEALQAVLEGKMNPDAYGRYTICNLYYDTDRFDLIRASIEKPVYKEKLRMRCYGIPSDENPVFLEMKKKYDGVVYKRRITLPYADAKRFIKTGVCETGDSQIMDELRYFMRTYPVEEKAFICYDRLALTGIENPELRVTFDSNIRFRQTELGLDRGTFGTDILDFGERLMEIKAPGALPVWLGRALSELQIFPTSFSKYGTCYSRYLSGQYLGKEAAASA